MTVISTTRLPPIPDPKIDAASQFYTLMALKHAVDILALNAAGVPKVKLFALQSELELLREQFEDYKRTHP